ncbi:MAG: cytochrome c [Bacteroidota bacterium]
MRYLFILLTIILGIYACASNDTNKVADHTTVSAQIDPEKIWKARCVSCHGRFGNMEANGAANLQVATSDLDYRVKVITNGKGVMNAWGDVLSEKEILAVAEYTLQFNPNLDASGK